MSGRGRGDSEPIAGLPPTGRGGDRGRYGPPGRRPTHERGSRRYERSRPYSRHDTRYDDRYGSRGGHSPEHGSERSGRRSSGTSGGGIRISSSRPDVNGNQRIVFRSYEEEREWVDNRRRNRHERQSKFDQEPTPEQLAMDAAAAAVGGGNPAVSRPGSADTANTHSARRPVVSPQQTRHARRLYVGHLPPDVGEDELKDFFRTSIRKALVDPSKDDGEDPIMSVYLNIERRFCFLEFRTVGTATACLAFDGININGKGKLKVKRPNDYNPVLAPKISPEEIPEFDVGKLGIISGTVEDGPNKVFVGGLHYHLSEEQVLEILQAFGKVKSFHLVKSEPDAPNSKGYCFLEYADPKSTLVAVAGLNGMDLGGGKVITARVATQRGSSVPAPQPQITAAVMQAAAAVQPTGTASMVIAGYEIEEMLDAAMGLKPMPVTPTHFDQFGIPMTRTLPIAALPGAATATDPVSPPPIIAAVPPPPPPPPPPPSNPVSSLPGASSVDTANAAIKTAFGGTSEAGGASVAPPSTSSPSRILVLNNMVEDEDLATDDEYEGLKEEVEGECAKFGKLLGMKIPRQASGDIAESAIKKIFLEYATVQDAQSAEKELGGRKFGSSVVQTSYLPEESYNAGKLY